jgi:hypothetical protein
MRPEYQSLYARFQEIKELYAKAQTLKEKSDLLKIAREILIKAQEQVAQFQAEIDGMRKSGTGLIQTDDPLREIKPSRKRTLIVLVDSSFRQYTMCNRDRDATVTTRRIILTRHGPRVPNQEPQE